MGLTAPKMQRIPMGINLGPHPSQELPSRRMDAGLIAHSKVLYADYLRSMSIREFMQTKAYLNSFPLLCMGLTYEERAPIWKAVYDERTLLRPAQGVQKGAESLLRAAQGIHSSGDELLRPAE